ncbi:putative aminodeoxychorismate synthase [Lachnellula subtilissima]|uniref:aminodeoxychorismate synthase n=1 Tax=Lachnellula subtilissima TaxID=602034 RepID=A0A8H8RC91_9HELO|nr:putative aminodeoxychorismate synthase [Lachnellula subtilissima]
MEVPRTSPGTRYSARTDRSASLVLYVAMLIPKPLILFIDAYDSFSNNIISLLEISLNASVRTVKIDDPALATDEALHEELSHYAAVVCGPGPGHPGREEDVGVMKRIWKTEVPVLGICLGFQSLCLEFGGVVRRLKGPQHGMIRRVNHAEEDGKRNVGSIFEGVGDIYATLYQSLCADIGQDLIPEKLWGSEKWKSTKQCPDLLPLAWVESDLSEESDSGVRDARVLVAVQHRTRPFWALQYHPESICTNEESRKVIINWFKVALHFNRTLRQPRMQTGGSSQGKFATRDSLLSRFESFRLMLNGSAGFPVGEHFRKAPYEHSNGVDNIYYSRTVDLPGNTSVAEIVESLGYEEEQIILLESSNAYEKAVGTADVRGRYSIIALDIKDSLRFEYTTGSNQISAIYPADAMADKYTTDLRQFGGVWSFLAQYVDKRKVQDGKKDSPFWGGFMGYTTYELGLEGIDVQARGRKSQPTSRPDLCFAWVTRSVVIDHVKSCIYIQQLAPTAAQAQAEQWMYDMGMRIANTSYRHPLKPRSTTNTSKPGPSVTTPPDSEYESKVRDCQESIRSGDSYELCLTDQTTITRPYGASWDLYTSLRTRQPAPFASYIRLGPLTLVSSSPERFLSWTEAGKCELRPMKGTVRKAPASPPSPTRAPSSTSPRKKAENLMIVDLVRHDLHGVCGSGNVTVPRLMVVEEYASVFQMITVVQGQIPSPLSIHMDVAEADQAKRTWYTGLDVLAASLPPGSMTGAPKKRSCEILQSVEGGRERSLYSGVVGYMDVGGRGDFSVTIRSMYRWDDDFTSTEAEGEEKQVMEKWHIGAGGGGYGVEYTGGREGRDADEVEWDFGSFLVYEYKGAQVLGSMCHGMVFGRQAGRQILNVFDLQGWVFGAGVG